MLEGEYEPSPAKWVRDQVERYEATDGREANTLRDTGLPVVIFTTRGNKTGKIRKTPLMRVEHDGRYALIASQGGAPKHPVWYLNLKADPSALMVQDGADRFDARARELRVRSARLVGACGGGLPALRGVPAQDRPSDTGAAGRAPGLIRRPSGVV